MKVDNKKDYTIQSKTVGSNRLNELQKQAEAILQEIQKERNRLKLNFVDLEFFMDNLNEGVVVFDQSRNIILANDIAAKMYGYKTKKDFMDEKETSIKSYDLETGKFIPYHKWPSARVLKGEVFENTEIQIENEKDGRNWVESYSGKLIKNKKGNKFIIASVRDVTERWKAEEAKSQLASIVDFSTDAIIAKDMTGAITTWNKGAEKLLGYKAEEMIGKKTDIYVPKEIREDRTNFKKYIERKVDQGLHESKRITKQGKIISVSVVHSPIIIRGKTVGTSTISRDITERKKFEERQNEFMSMASHELKTPVTIVKAFVQILENRLSYLKDIQSLDYVKKMSVQTNKIIELINDLLDAGKIESNQLTLKKEVFMLNKLIDEVVEDVKTTTADTHRFIIKENVKVKVSADRFRLYQVLNNLLINAVKYSPYYSDVIVKSKRKGRNVEVSVIDRGIGISKENQGKIFGKFFMTQSNGNTKKGSGLGLYIAAEIIRRHDSFIKLKSIKGKGSTFSFVLPIAK